MFDYNGINYSQIIKSGYSTATFENHSMGNSLQKYIEMKLQDIIFDNTIQKFMLLEIMIEVVVFQ